ncbi:MAG: LysM peptidoglycan-binding domain-containing protein [Candidatus Shapirobacteria bacterium]|nr:LysM peptidoglycan-binding domain-containing protein [Candidatus Shapirobacteria bacterium]
MFLIKAGKKYIKSSEELVSMLLGLAIVVVVVSLIFNFVQRKKGSVEIPGEANIVLSDEAIKQKQEENGVYIVEKGDSLWKIAEKKYNDGYSWTKIAKENNLKNVSVLYVGQKLKMSVDETVITTSKIDTNNKIDQGDYKVVRNDNLWNIAVRAYGDGYKWTDIWQENKAIIRNPSLLEIGMMIKIPKL